MNPPSDNMTGTFVPSEKQAHPSDSSQPFTSSNDDAESNCSSNLPPVDGGAQAWLFLAGCFVMEALVFGTFSPHAPSAHVLTPSRRTRILFRCLSGLLQHTCAIRRIWRHCCHRHPDYRTHVSRSSICALALPTVSSLGPLVFPDGAFRVLLLPPHDIFL